MIHNNFLAALGAPSILSRHGYFARLENFNTYIKYRKMKDFNEEQFKSTLKETPWDSVFVFDDIDDMLSLWESLFNSALDSNCPWRVKRVAKARKSPWLDSSVIKQLRERDRLLKIAKRSKKLLPTGKVTKELGIKQFFY